MRKELKIWISYLITHGISLIGTLIVQYIISDGNINPSNVFLMYLALDIFFDIIMPFYED